MESTDEIKMVSRVTRDGGDYTVVCPHCKAVIGIEGDDMSEIIGAQYDHGGKRGCGGTFEISQSARYVREL